MQQKYSQVDKFLKNALFYQVDIFHECPFPRQNDEQVLYGTLKLKSLTFIPCGNFPQGVDHGKAVFLTCELQCSLFAFSATHLTYQWQRATLQMFSAVPTSCSYQLLPSISI